MAAIRFVLWMFGGYRWEGVENVPLEGGVLITPNHISDTDPPTVAAALPRACYFMAKEELFAMPVLGPFIRLARGFPVKRYSADRAALRHTENLLKQGEAVVIFPEGKLSEDGSLQDFLPGALMVAQRANVPIVPTIIEGTNALMPYGELVPRPAGRKMIVRFGPPITMDVLTQGKKGGDALKLAALRLRAMMLALQEGNPYPPLHTIQLPAEARKTQPTLATA
jgi:1-acyl-sn-glycerol-3-phosphate acyltransferase